MAFLVLHGWPRVESETTQEIPAQRFLVNSVHITSVVRCGEHCLVSMQGGALYVVQETFEALKEALGGKEVW